ELAPPEGPPPEPQLKLSIHSVAFSTDGTLLACGCRDGTVWLWDRSTGKPGPTLSGHIGPVLSVVFAADGKTLATAGEDKTVRLWDLFTAQERLILKGHADA